MHASDCARHNEPAYPNGPCDCGLSLPHIRMINGRWCCCGDGVEGYGATIELAYVEWGIADFNRKWWPR